MHKHMKNVNGSQKIQNLGLFTKMNFKKTRVLFQKCQKFDPFWPEKKIAFFVTFFPTHYGSGRERGRDASAFLKAI